MLTPARSNVFTGDGAISVPTVTISNTEKLTWRSSHPTPGNTEKGIKKFIESGCESEVENFTGKTRSTIAAKQYPKGRSYGIWFSVRMVVMYVIAAGKQLQNSLHLTMSTTTGRNIARQSEPAETICCNGSRNTHSPMDSKYYVGIVNGGSNFLASVRTRENV
jgi:hypothetical protein